MAPEPTEPEMRHVWLYEHGATTPGQPCLCTATATPEIRAIGDLEVGDALDFFVPGGPQSRPELQCELFAYPGLLFPADQQWGAMSEAAANEAIWRELLTGEGSRFARHRRRNRRVPGRPRCKTCLIPLSGPISRVLRMLNDLAPSAMNPNYCNQCERFVHTHPGGAEIELTLLFADIRGSTRLAEQKTTSEFRQLLNRFYEAANRVVIDSDGLVDKLVGDEVIGLYLPVSGPDHARRAILAARDLLLATGHRDADGPWVPVGAGVHTGTAYVGAVGSQAVSDFTALGDAVNVTARLSSVAAAGEVLISESSYPTVRDELGELELRHLDVKGHDARIDVRVLRLASM